MMRPSPLREALASSRGSLVTVAWLSALINVLLLAGPLYMMLIYESVMPSGSGATLVGLLVMVIVVYSFQGLFDNFRLRLLADTAAAFDEGLAGKVHRAMLRATRDGSAPAGNASSAMRDLDAVRTFLSSAGPPALMDLPWILLFLALLFLLHPWLGLLGTVGAVCLAGVTFANDRLGRAPTEVVATARSERGRLLAESLRHAELVHALGMEQRLEDRWLDANRRYNQASDRIARLSGGFSSGSRVFRMLLQSLVLTAGAAVYLAGEASGGVVFAASFLSARALAPVEQAIANWRGFVAARKGWRRLETELDALAAVPVPRIALERPAQSLAVEDLSVTPPGSAAPVLDAVSFELAAGDALGVIGPTAAGKSSLARALLGLWPAAQGTVRLDGAELGQWSSEGLGSMVGYLPQQVELLEGTIAENIARMDREAPDEAIIAAARAAGVHDMIVGFEKGYDTPIGPEGALLSGGQSQRLGLARALYNDPFLVVLDEPNSNLDTPGEEALDRAISQLRMRGAIVVLVAHRPSALRRVNKLLLLDGGRVTAFGDRDTILPRVLPGGVATVLHPERTPRQGAARP